MVLVAGASRDVGKRLLSGTGGVGDGSMVILPEWEMRMRSWVNGFSSSYERMVRMATDFQGAQTAIWAAPF